MSGSILIKNGRIVTAQRDYHADLFIENGKIGAIGHGLNMKADRIIDAASKYVVPGGIDVHTHLEMPVGSISTADDFETGTRAAAFGGTTSIIDFIGQSRGMKMRDALGIRRQMAENKACIDYGFHMIITHLVDSCLGDMDEMVGEGITSFKLFMAYPGSLMADDSTIIRAMRRSAENGGLICIHAENGEEIDALVRRAVAEGKTEPIYHALTRPPETEAVAVERAVRLAKETSAALYVVHVSSGLALREIANARSGGLPVYAETCPQYLFTSVEDLATDGFEGAKYVFTPPPRERSDRDELWEGLRNGSLQVVSTDHCPFNFAGDKDLGRYDFTKIPNGCPGIETRMGLVFDWGVNNGRISLNRWVDIVSTAPARIFGMYPQKGTIEIGSDADIVIWDPGVPQTISARTHHMRVDYSLYEGVGIKGAAETVMSRGEVIVENKEWHGRAGRGKFLKRKRFSVI